MLDFARWSTGKRYHIYANGWIGITTAGCSTWKTPAALLPPLYSAGIRTMIVVGLNYRWPENLEQPQEAMISKYAWAEDYHKVMLPMLQDLAAQIQQLSPEAATKVYVDTGPIVEKHWAQKAGVGWIGKHTNVFNQKGSSWMFLGEVLTDLLLEPDPPAEDHCGTCVQCIEACPTGAIVAPYVLDSRLCISYLTIEFGTQSRRSFVL